MDITPQDSTRQPISDDQELAQALAGVLPDVPEPVIQEDPADPLQFEESPVPVVVPNAAPVVTPDPVVVAKPTPRTSTANPSDLDTIKKDALEQLRPLIDKVDLPAEEKFDTYLMLIRSTDDASLIAPAHVAAQAITDEKRRAEALLDIIKEIDYLSRNNQPAT